MPSTVTSSSAAFGRCAFGIGQPVRDRSGRTDIVKGRSVRSGGNVLTTLSCSASGIFAICCDLTRPTIRLARTFQSTRTRRRRGQCMPLVAFCLRHFLADFIICMCEFDFRQAHYLCNQRGVVKTNQTIARARKTISMSMVPEKTIEECKRHVDECAALLERTSVPEYREAIIAMAKAWMKIAEQAKIKASR